jgi:dienelactone hydrolase
VHTLSRAGLDHTIRSTSKLERELEELVYMRSDHPIEEARILVGHSQGGNAALLLAERRPDLVAGVITLGAPIQGTNRASHVIPIPSVRCMTTDWARTNIGHPRHCRVVSICAEHDLLVQPHWNALLEGAENYSFPTGHLGLVLDPRVLSFVRNLVRNTAWPESPTEVDMVA